MGNYFCLVNVTDNEFIEFRGFMKEGEIFGNYLPCLMVTYYLFDNGGDKIYFVGDEWNPSPAPWYVGYYGNGVSEDEGWRNATKELLDNLVEDELIKVKDKNGDLTLLDNYEIVK